MTLLVLCAHPRLNESRANRALALEASKLDNIHVRYLYREYPDWNIDANKERQALLRYDRIVFLFPFYWYSSPPLLKKWFDDVLTFGWAYGPGGERLKGKEFIVATTAGGPENSYRSGGDNSFTVSELLRPIQRTLTRCNGTYLPAFVVYNANAGTDAYLAQEAERFLTHIQAPSLALVH